MAPSPGPDPVELRTRRLRAEEYAEPELAFSPDGALLACASSYTDPVLVWETATGRQAHAFAAGYEAEVAFAPAGDRLAIADREAVSVWDLRSGGRVARFPFGPREAPADDEPMRLHFSPAGRQLALLAQNYLQVWDVAAGRQARRFGGDAEDDAFDFLFAGAGAVVLSHYLPGDRPGLYVSGFDLAAGQRTFLARKADPLRTPLTPDRRRALVCADWDARRYEVWDTAAGRRAGALELEDHWALPVFSADGRHVSALLKADDSVGAWDAWSGMAVNRIAAGGYHQPRCGSAAHRLLAVALVNGQHSVGPVGFYDPVTGAALGRADRQVQSGAGGHLFSPCGRWFASVLTGNANDLGDSPDPVGTVYLTDLAPILPQAQKLDPAR